MSDGGEDWLPHGAAVAQDVALVDEGGVREVLDKVRPGPIVHEAVLQPGVLVLQLHLVLV